MRPFMDGAASDPEGFAREHRWVRVRLAGWILLGLWQAASLVNEFAPLMLNTRAARVLMDVSGLAGLVLVAWGFERIVAESHRRQGEMHGVRPGSLPPGPPR